MARQQERKKSPAQMRGLSLFYPPRFMAEGANVDPLGSCMMGARVFPERLLSCSSRSMLTWLRHAAGYALAARGVDTRTLQAFMGHRSIANTVIYTAVADKRIRNIWGK
jgi:hypothetical protein